MNNLENIIQNMSSGSSVADTAAETVSQTSAMPLHLKVIGIVIIALLVVMLLVLGVSLLYYRKNFKNDEVIKKNKKSGKNHLYIAYKIFNNTPGIKKYFSRVKKNTESMFPSDPMSVNKEATKIMLFNLGKMMLLCVLSILLAKGDIFYSLVGIVTSFVIFNYSVVAKFEKYEYMLLQQLQTFISDIRHYYLSNPIIEDAVQDTLEDIPYEISLHIEKIYEMLISPSMKEKIEDYNSYCPNRFFMLLVSICTTIKEYSDTILPDGSSNFLNSLNYLKEEINVEILKKKLIKDTFYGLEFISLIVVFFMKPIEAWAVNYMPDLKNFYQGSIGNIFVVLIFIISYIAYYFVDILKNSRRKEVVQNDIFSKIANMPIISPFLNKIINKNYTKALQLNEDMKEVGNQTGPKAFMIKRMFFGLAGFLLINTMFTTNVIQQKMTMLKEYVGTFDESVVPNKKYLEIMRKTSNEYALKLQKYDVDDLNEEELAKEIIAQSGVRNKTYAEIVAKDIIKQLKDYKNTYYKWYYLIISLLGTWFAYMLPDWFLKYQRKVSAMNKDDELNQFQTLVLILMYTDGISLDIILEWMERFSYVFKSSIEECIIELESGEKRALENMKNKEEYIPFKRFVDCLLQIDESDVPSAFGEILVDRTYSLKEREQQNQLTTYKKATTARRIAYAPLITVIICYLIGPMMILAVKMFFTMDLSL